jgi:hypothetical protein
MPLGGRKAVEFPRDHSCLSPVAIWDHDGAVGTTKLKSMRGTTMTRILALATAATITLAPAVQAQTMEMEFNMLTGAVFNALQSRGISTENIDELTLAEIATIRNLLNSGDNEGQITQRIEQILAEAGN